MYRYEQIDSSQFTKEYIEITDKIESLRHSLRIQSNRLSDIMNADIYNSTKIEGNTLTSREVTDYLNNKVTVRGKPLNDYRQVSNYSEMINTIGTLIKTKSFIVSEEVILQIQE